MKLKILNSLLLSGIILLVTSFCCNASDSSLNLHVPSPDWSDQVIYFVMLDRFNDGNPENNDQGYDEFDPQNYKKFSGGDLQGLIDKLDYIQELGATAVWITPPVANQWWDPKVGYGGYHGYWAEDFSETDAHFGSLDDYKRLSHELHQRGMYLIQDIVTNHTGNFFDYGLEYDPDHLDQHYYPNPQSKPVSKPGRYPFNQNDPLDLAQRELGIYHWTPSISDYNSSEQRLIYQVSSLDDINTTNPVVRKALREIYGYWIKEVGVDAFRIDTIIYLEEDFWNEFLYSTDPDAPGIDEFARATGRDDFLTFGEAFMGSSPLDDSGEKRVAVYLGSPEKPGVKSMINFPLYFTIGRVFGQGQPTQYLSYRLSAALDSGVYRNPFLLTNFIDNHDVQRFLAGATPASMKQALTFLMTIPGIPVIYQGTEQMFTDQRASMFAGGWGSDNADSFNTDSEMYSFTSSLMQIRKDYPVFSRGQLKIMADSEIGPGIFVYSRELNDQKAIVAFNTANQPMLISNVPTGLKAGQQLELLAGSQFSQYITVNPQGNITLEFPAQAAAVFLVGELQTSTFSDFNIALSGNPDGKEFSDDFVVAGTASHSVDDLLLIIDGKLNGGIPIQMDAQNNLRVNLAISRFPLGTSKHTLTIYSKDYQYATPVSQFATDVNLAGKTVSYEDPANDDHGPEGTYKIPGDATFMGQMDILNVQASVAGANLQVDLTMRDLSQVWLPPNGFDHVVFHLFIDLPDVEGSTILPLLNAEAPVDFDWDYLLYASGWSKSLFTPGSDSEKFGELSIPSPELFVDPASNTVSMNFSAEVFDGLTSLSGAKIYITTWDGSGSDGFHRPITLEGAMFEFGGSDDPNAVLIMDDTEVLLIP